MTMSALFHAFDPKRKLDNDETIQQRYYFEGQ